MYIYLLYNKKSVPLQDFYLSNTLKMLFENKQFLDQFTTDW